MDSTQVASNIRQMGRIQLLVTVLQRVPRMLSEEDREHYAETLAPYTQGHAGQYVYRLKGEEIGDHLQRIGTLMQQLLDELKPAYEEEPIYQVLERVFDEHFQMVEEAVRCKSNDQLSASSLQSPDDLEATYRNKRGQGVHGFTLDPAWGEFLLSHENIRFPEPPMYFSFNHAAEKHFSKEMSAYINWLQHLEYPHLSQRYVGSMVADFHRNLIHGGVFGYPAERSKPDGKIRLLYEAAPLAFIAEQAGGYGSDGTQSLLNIQPTDIHQRIPVFIGNRYLVEKAEEFIVNHHT